MILSFLRMAYFEGFLTCYMSSLPQKKRVSQGKAAILCLVELYLSVGEAWIC